MLPVMQLTRDDLAIIDKFLPLTDCLSGAVNRLDPPGFPILRQGSAYRCASGAQVFGGRVVQAPCGVMHGKTSLIHHSGVGLMQACSHAS